MQSLHQTKGTARIVVARFCNAVGHGMPDLVCPRGKPRLLIHTLDGMCRVTLTEGSSIAKGGIQSAVLDEAKLVGGYVHDARSRRERRA